MKQWHETIVAKIGLRIAGLVLLVSAWMAGGWLRALVAGQSGRDATAPQLLLAALVFLSASAGMALAVMGPALWEMVTVPDRWATWDGRRD